jgi:cyanophycinase
MNPKGKLLVIGGADETSGAGKSETGHFEILRDLLPAGKEKTIEIITTATGIRDDIQKLFLNELKKFGIPRIGFLNIANRDEANNPEFVNRIAEAGAVFFSGGDQFRISSVIGGTKLGLLLKERFQNDPEFIVAGMGAGAMAIPEIMIADGGAEKVPSDADLKTSSGLGLLKKCIIDTHFISQGRFGRLVHAVAINPMELGIGLGEGAALLIENGSNASCFGNGMIVIIDGQNIRHTNVAVAKTQEPIYVDNLTVHILVKGCGFSLEQRAMVEMEKVAGEK